MKRRDVLAGVGATALLGTAGCLGVAGLDEHEATPAGVDPEVRSSTGYSQVGIEELVIREQVDLPGLSEEVVVRNYLTEHDKGIDLGPLGRLRAAVFTVLTSPQISIAGRELNSDSRDGD
ncbi:uncharacterized protein NP_2890A [Natronomonas pharaonis DSM 2160]|uniref:Uncharacterized protein n=1 Tax=Natronomonas pharaonis (strain ATCC 35678 / DSM 2160 / CIP 103997 / JCM 8858 / NBRC 14720 / NCIMB 2260 / Gabara) TaxID=348780 RepID=A0A1U7EWQ9_NATPD|nr:DUF6517 family protein [Natronomonas pharaonis]CAI49536.1 uncharacterized protein NP_2890A [Natronomonas pharaonis DSM 2160]